MAKREFLLLAHPYSAPKHGACPGWLMSEKLDGIRAFWDGGISREIAACDVPYANCAKHARYVVAPIASGLWSRYGQPIQAPGWWLDQLPKIPLDGELWTGRQGFQATSSTVRCLTGNDEEWKAVKYCAFDSPPLATVFAPGKINNAFFKLDFGMKAQLWASERLVKLPDVKTLQPETPFYKSLAFLREYLPEGEAPVRVHHQESLPEISPAARAKLQQRLSEIEASGGEGVMLRSPVSFWTPERSWNLLKVKTLQDMEGTIVGYRWGKPTDLDRSLTGDATDKLLGLMGCVILKLDSGVTFDLGSGFTHAERVMGDKHHIISDAVKAHGIANPGLEVPEWIENPLFKRGEKITFKYRELSNDGVPKEARYMRKAE